MTYPAGRLFALLSILGLSHLALASVVGIGTPGSCTEPALAAAIPAGGVITFNCGAGPQTIAMTYTPVLFATQCLFQNNTTGGGAISIQGGIASIDDSTFSGNSAPGGGAIIVEVLNPGSVVRIVNDTFTNNTVASNGQGSAIYVGGGPMTITNCTIAGNAAGAAGGAVYFGANKTAMANTILASNSGGNCAGGSFSGGRNLQFGDAPATARRSPIPHLSPLANNGDATQTMALAARTGTPPPPPRRHTVRR